MSDQELLLLERARKGDVEAFEKLIEGCQRKVFNIALKMLDNYDDAAETAQEVFIKLYKSISGFQGKSSFSTWVYRITVNMCLDELRKRKCSKTISLDETITLKEREVKIQIEDDKPTPDIQAEKNELVKTVNDAIRDLSDEHKTVIILRDIHGFSYEQIASMINCPEGTIKSRINRARQSLKEILKTKKELLNISYVK